MYANLRVQNKMVSKINLNYLLITYVFVHINDIVVITHEMENLHAACYGSKLGDCVPTTQFCILQLLVHDDFTRCIQHVTMVSTWLSCTKCMIIGHGINA